MERLSWHEAQLIIQVATYSNKIEKLADSVKYLSESIYRLAVAKEIGKFCVTIDSCEGGSNIRE